ncbi:MAG: bifunctional nuclease family protein [Candidatus Woesearchaeota archaeon]|nr:MAG: bifunctional nuclease family protein [Candidatus Woesearchaeota archaeon]
MRVTKTLMGILIGLVVVTAITFATLQYLEIDESDYIKIEVIKVGDQGFIFLGNDSCTGIIAKTSEERAQSMKLGLEKEIEFRPNTHDIFSAALEHFNITLNKVIIHKMAENTYFSDMILIQGNRVLKLDSKPSDAISVALRTNSSIYINKTLFEERKEKIC